MNKEVDEHVDEEVDEELKTEIPFPNRQSQLGRIMKPAAHPSRHLLLRSLPPKSVSNKQKPEGKHKSRC